MPPKRFLVTSHHSGWLHPACVQKWTETYGNNCEFRCTGIDDSSSLPHFSRSFFLYGNGFVAAHDPVGTKPSKPRHLQKRFYFVLVYNCLNEKEIIALAFCKQ